MFALFFTYESVSADEFDKEEIISTRVSDAINMLEGSGGNIALCIGSDGAFMVDDQYAPLTPTINAAMANITD